MKATIVGLITPHILKIIDLANQAEAGANVDFHLRDTVGRTVNELAEQFNADELLAAFTQGIEAAIHDAKIGRTLYVSALKKAVTMAAQSRRA